VTVYVVPGVFSADDNNYLINVLALRQGRVTVANTAGLPPSRELLSFDPGPWSRRVESTPVASTAPPLYALLAFPFHQAGWRGLVALNTLAYSATIFLVFAHADRYARHRSTPWLAAATFALGGFAIEYAQGLWPHSLSVMLCAAGVFAIGRLVDGGRLWLAAAAGLGLGLATGIRYQNVVLLIAAGLALMLWGARRRRALAIYALAASLPVMASSVINHARLESWNPVSKGEGYLDVPPVTDPRSTLADAFVMTWARVVDFTARPRLTSPAFASWLMYDTRTGAHLIQGLYLKKSLLQSAPWAIVPLILFVLAWVPRFRVLGGQRRQLQVLSFVTVAVLGMFAVSGVGRDDGMSFNQRYLLDLLPLLAVGFAWALDGLLTHSRMLAVGGVIGALGVLTIFTVTDISSSELIRLPAATQLAVLKTPLLLAVGLGLAWILTKMRLPARRALAVTVGMCLGWALTLHLVDDVRNSQRVRRYNLGRTSAMAAVLDDRSALVAYWWHKDPAVPLLFERDIVILDARADEGRDAPKLVRALMRDGRRVFLLEDGFPSDVRERALMGLRTTPVSGAELSMIELRLGPM
jgi:hypothetical protein